MPEVPTPPSSMAAKGPTGRAMTTAPTVRHGHEHSAASWA